MDSSKTESSEPEHDKNSGETIPPEPTLRWVRYISQERRVLWHDCPLSKKVLPYNESVAGAREWRNAIDAVFATRLPQNSVKTLVFDHEPHRFSLKVFPDFGVGNQFRGVVQVVELLPEPRSGSTTSFLVDGRNREPISSLDLTLSAVALFRAADNVIVRVNRRLAQETGYAVNDLTGMPGEMLFGDDGVRLLKNTHQRLVTADGGVVWGQALHLRDRQGRLEQYFCSLTLATREDGKKDDNVLVVSVDGIEQDTATGLIREGPNPRFVLEALQDGIWEYDAINRVFFYNKSFAHIFGHDGIPGGVGKDVEEWFESIHPGEPDKVLRSWRQLLKRGSPYRVFYRIRDNEGEWRWIVATIHAILNDSHGRPARIIGFHMDISDAMRTEKNLSDIEERLRVVFENSGLGIALANTDGSVYRANPALAHILGRDLLQFDGQLLEDFAHEESRAELRQSLERLVHGGRKEHLPDVRFSRPDGRETWVNFTATLSRKVSDGGRYLIVTVEDVTTARATREKLQYEATHDVMTGAWSRWVLFERLGQHIHIAQRYAQPMAFCLCDLDHFKRVNDMYGHQAGDQVLIRFVEVLKETLRDTDVIGRYGGEEFGVVFPNTTPESAAESLERALAQMRTERFADNEGREFIVTATIGIAGVVPGCDMKQVVAWADDALYKGKESGRDHIVSATPPEGEKWL